MENDAAASATTALVPHPPPSFSKADDDGNLNYPSSPRQTPPRLLFPLFVLINLITLSDRAIIPGASTSFSSFVSSASDTPESLRANPDAGLGLLQAAFVGGYSVAIVISGHLVHKIPWRALVGVGMAVWTAAVFFSGLARRADSFYLLLFSRMATGVSEASFHVVAPPTIQDRGGSRAGLWLSIYLTAIPVGLAIGYAYGALVSHSSLGWQWAFYLECILAVPLLIALACVRDDENGGVLRSVEAGVVVPGLDDDDDDDHDGGSTVQLRSGPSSPSSAATTSIAPPSPSDFTLWEEIRACLTSPVLLCVTAAYAAMIAVVATLGTFGGAFILALQLFDDEESAAITFGVAAAAAGIIGTPLGGRLADRVVLDAARRGGHTELEGGPSSHWSVLSNLLPYINGLIVCALLFCWPTTLMTKPVPFLLFLFVGWLFLFATNAGVTLCVMLSVEYRHRPNALAFATLVSHVIGDVPAPVLLGALKDTLAPACTIDPGSGNFVDPEGCAAQQGGVRATLAVAYAWMTWSVLFFEAARRLSLREERRAAEAATGGGERGIEDESSSGGGAVFGGGSDGGGLSNVVMADKAHYC